MACPICKNKKKRFSISVKDYEYNMSFSAQYTQCYYCKSLYRSNPKNINKIEKKIYLKNKYLPVKGNYFYDILKGFNASNEKSIILKKIGYNYFDKKITLLDVACGKGYLIKKFSKIKNLQCIGIDINIKNYKKNNLTFLNSSYKNFNLLKKINPDILIINNFIEHIDNLKNFEKILKLIKKGSYVIIFTPDSNSCARIKFSKFWSGYHSPRHKVIFNSTNIKKLFNSKIKIKFNLFKSFDPFSNFVSVVNFSKFLLKNLSFYNAINLINFIFYLFIDIKNKNRVVVIAQKK